MSIIGFLAFISFRLTPSTTFHEQQEARLVCAFIATQAATSVARQQEISIVISPCINTLQAGKRILHLQYLQCGAAPFAYGPPSQPTNPITSASSFDSNTIVCKPDGNIRHGSLYLVNANKTMVYAVTIPVLSVASIRLYSCTAASNWQLRSIEW